MKDDSDRVILTKCWKCGEFFDPENRLQLIRHQQDFCVTCPKRKKYQRAHSGPPVGTIEQKVGE